MNVNKLLVTATAAAALFGPGGASAQQTTPAQADLARNVKVVPNGPKIDLSRSASMADLAARLAQQRGLASGAASAPAAPPPAAGGAKPVSAGNVQLGAVPALPTGPAVTPQRPGVPATVTVVQTPAPRGAGVVAGGQLTGGQQVAVPQTPIVAGDRQGAGSGNSTGNTTGGVVRPEPVRPLPVNNGGRDTGSLNPGNNTSPIGTVGQQPAPVVVPTPPVVIPQQPITVPAQPVTGGVTGGDVRPTDPPRFHVPPEFQPNVPGAAAPAIDLSSANTRSRQVDRFGSADGERFGAFLDELLGAQAARAEAPRGAFIDEAAARKDAETLQRAVNHALSRPDGALLPVAVQKLTEDGNFFGVAGGASAFKGAIDKLAGVSGVNRAAKVPAAVAEMLALGERPSNVLALIKAMPDAASLRSAIASLQANGVDLAPQRADIDAYLGEKAKDWQVSDIRLALGRDANEPMKLQAPQPQFVRGDAKRFADMTSAIARRDLGGFKSLLANTSGTDHFAVSMATSGGSFSGAATGNTAARQLGPKPTVVTHVLEAALNAPPAYLQALIDGANDHARAVERTNAPSQDRAALISRPSSWTVTASMFPAGDAGNGARVAILMRAGVKFSAREALNLLNRSPEVAAQRELLRALVDQGGEHAGVALAAVGSLTDFANHVTVNSAARNSRVVRAAAGDRDVKFVAALDAAIALAK